MYFPAIIIGAVFLALGLWAFPTPHYLNATGTVVSTNYTVSLSSGGYSSQMNYYPIINYNYSYNGSNYAGRWEYTLN